MSELLIDMKEEIIIYLSGGLVDKIAQFCYEYYIYKINTFLKNQLVR